MHRAMRSTFFAFIVVCLVLPFTGRAEVGKSALISLLKNKELTSLIVIGSHGAPIGYQGSYPVNTLVYLDGQVVYRVEWAFMRGEARSMTGSFPTGSLFTVSDVDIKSDRLSLKLLARNRESAHLELILGQGWQQTMNASDVLASLSHSMRLPGQITDAVQPKTLAANGAPIVKATPAEQIPTYSRPADATVISGRISASEAAATLAGIQQEMTSAVAQIARSSESMSRGLRAFQAVYTGRRDPAAQRASEEISSLQANLGVDLLPRDESSVHVLENLFDQCKRLAIMRQVGGGYGREVGPGGNNADYFRAFLSPQLNADLQQDRRELAIAVRLLQSQKFAREGILAVEKSLDAGDYQSALNAYQNIPSTSPSAARYLQASAHLRDDLTTYQAATQLKPVMDTSIPAMIETLEKQDALLQQSSQRPITATYLSSILTIERRELIGAIKALPSFYLPGRPVDAADSATKSTAAARLQVINDALNVDAALVAVVSDSVALSSVRSLVGDGPYSELLSKGKGIGSAKTEAINLDARLQSIQEAEHEAVERRERAAEERAGAPGEIVDTVCQIVKLREEFGKTQLMGYLMQIDKEKAILSKLAATYRTPDVWSEVDAQYQRILPGLTVAEAAEAQALLNSARK